VAAHYALSSLFKPYTDTDHVYCYTVEQQDVQARETGRARLVVGAAKVTSEITLETDTFTCAGVYIGDNSMSAGVAHYEGDESYARLKEDIVAPFTRADFPEIVRIFDRYFGDSTYSLRSIFHDDQRKIVDIILRSTLTEAEAVYRQLYETHAPMMRFLADLRIPPPRFLQAAGEFALNCALREAFENLDSNDPVRLRAILDEAQSMNVRLDSATLAFTLTGTIERLSQRLVEEPENVGLIQRIEQASSLAEELPFEINVWKAQNSYYELLQRFFPDFSERAQRDDPAAREWLSHFVALGRNLHVRVEEPVFEEMEMAS
jgi:hypothetical protein